MRTFLQICQYISNMPNSELSTVTTLSDVTDEQKNAINRALLNVWNNVPKGDIRFATTSFNTVVGQNNYPMVNGIIIEKGVKCDGKYLPIELNPQELDETSGTPTKHYIEGGEIILYPNPDSVKQVIVKYRNKYAVITTGGVKQSSFVNSSDILNISERVEDEFIECLGHLTNQLLNADQTDEDYLEHAMNYKKSLEILKSVDLGTEESTASFTL